MDKWQAVERHHEMLRNSSAAGEVAVAADKRAAQYFAEFMDDAFRVVWSEFPEEERGYLFMWMAIHTLSNGVLTSVETLRDYMQKLAEKTGRTIGDDFAPNVLGQVLLTVLSEAEELGMITKETAKALREQLRVYDAYAGSGMVHQPNKEDRN